jgi:tetratricopeptide (TPR) repeat protein
MRRSLILTAVATAVLGMGPLAGKAFAFSTVVGGLAGACSAAAKAGEHDPKSLGECTLALQHDSLSRHDLAGTHVNRGAMELMNKDLESAHEDFDKALEIMPTMGEAHIGEGVYLISMERWPEAEAQVDQGIKLGSEEPEKGYYFRGLARWGQDNYKGAYLDFRKALDLKPEWKLPQRQLTNFKVEPPQ